MDIEQALDSGGCVAAETESNATFYCSTFYNNSARWEGGCLYSGVGEQLDQWNCRKPTGERTQGFFLFGNGFNLERIADGNFLENEGILDRGSKNLYLWFVCPF